MLWTPYIHRQQSTIREAIPLTLRRTVDTKSMLRETVLGTPLRIVGHGTPSSATLCLGQP